MKKPKEQHTRKPLTKKQKIIALLVWVVIIGGLIFACTYQSPEEKAASEAAKVETQRTALCMSAAEQEVNKYISGAQYSWNKSDWQIKKITKDSGTELWSISTTISIKNVVEKQKINVIITVIDDDYYKAHYVAVGNVVYYNNGFAEE